MNKLYPSDVVVLMRRIEDYKLSDKLGSEREKEMNAELDLLRTQVRDLRGQRDDLVEALEKLSKMYAFTIADEALAKVGAGKTAPTF